jgi:hypothetical protein
VSSIPADRQCSWALAVQTEAHVDAIVGDVQDSPDAHCFVRHPLVATVYEAAHLRQIAAEGTSPATPAIMVAAVLAFVVPFVTMLILLVFVVADFS